MKIMALILIMLLSGCVNLMDMNKHTNYAYSGEVQGDHFVLARCVIDTMEADNRFQINSLKYKISVDPKMERTRVDARGVSIFGPFYAFNLELNKTTPRISSINLEGVKFESEEALKILKRCVRK